MKNFLLLILLFCLAAPNSFGARVVESIVAIVDNEVITRSELEMELASLRRRYEIVYEGARLEKKIEALEKEVLERLIEEKILSREAKDRKIEPSEEKVEKQFKEFRSRFPSEEEFLVAMKKQGLTERALKQKIKEQLARDRLVNREVKTKVAVGMEEIKDFYQSNKNTFQAPAKYKLSLILIRADDEDKKQKARAKAEKVLSQLKEGEDFHRLAKRYSDGPAAERGGMIGFVSREELRPKLGKVLPKLKVGQFSNIVETPAGFHILKKEGEKPAVAKRLEEVKDKIRQIIFARKAEEKYHQWMDELKKKVYIEVKVE